MQYEVQSGFVLCKSRPLERGCNMDLGYVRCGALESLNHVHMWCPKAVEDFIDNLLELLDTDRRDHGLLVTWSLWFHRNIRCWMAIDVGATAIVAFVVQFLQDRKDAEATCMQVQQPPAVNCLRQSA
ncbi:hypothetical protein GOBAR_DD35890 [Gossypium barbadense]|nr:hypothetical protein GOBAR_DD35890 [Gossypium barbadense]